MHTLFLLLLRHTSFVLTGTVWATGFWQQKHWHYHLSHPFRAKTRQSPLSLPYG
ncbi:hypothetical protein B0F90DRAFT_1781477 [Multifurca ochricompacta]|uniref:Uncharacterized protein n=1 Tax=Multifurca ochricompacta TaxID=376703 RepID=A0AAD4LVA3_9AGAM|nr:hypothetical protein B0F90DRAFT_1781477 [Multifurca ochricompacta]